MKNKNSIQTDLLRARRRLFHNQWSRSAKKSRQKGYKYSPVIFICAINYEGQELDNLEYMSSQGQPGIVLVAENEVMLRNLVRQVLERAGFRVLTAANGAEALKLSRNHPDKIDLLVTDMNMPRMRGTVLAQHIKCERPETAILIMSSEKNAWVEESGTPFLAKPFSPDALVCAVRSLIRSATEAATHRPDPDSS